MLYHIYHTKNHPFNLYNIVQINDFLGAIKRDPQVQIKVKDVLHKYNRLPYSYQSKIGEDTVNQNVSLKKIINSMGTIIKDIEKELKKKSTEIKYLESRLL